MSRARNALFAAALLATATMALGQDPATELVQRLEPEATYLNPLQVNQWIGLDANRSVSGKLVSLGESGEVLPRSAIEVTLMQKGKTVSRAVTGADGIFQFRGVKAGTYTFVAQSEYSFATFGIHVLPPGSGSPTSFEACVSTVSSSSVRELIKDHWVPSESDVVDVFEKDPLANVRKVSGSTKVLLQNGDLLGQVSRAGVPISQQDLTGNVAHIFKGGRSIAAAPIGRDGRFRVVSLAPGVYDLAVVGDDGIAVIGFEAVGPKPIAGNQSAGNQSAANESAAPAQRLVTFQDIPTVLSVELAEPTAIVPQPEEIPLVQDPSMLDGGFSPVMGGGFGSPGGFGGGGFGRGGGLGGGGGGGGIAGGGIGGLLGIAGLAVGVAALANNDNFDPGQASLIGP